MAEKVDLICKNNEQLLQLLPGFRFYPTEEELVGFYLRRKVEKKSFKFNVIRDLDLYAFEPWDLPGLALNGGEREWFFFVKLRGHSNGRPNRITAGGFWKATGTDKPVYTHSTSTLIGLRKTLVFYKGRSLKGQKTDWIMNEYRFHPGENENGGGVRLCRVYRKASSVRSFDRRPRIQVEERANFNNDGHSFSDCNCSGESRLSITEGAENLRSRSSKVEQSEDEDLTHLKSLERWWCPDYTDVGAYCNTLGPPWD